MVWYGILGAVSVVLGAASVVLRAVSVGVFSFSVCFASASLAFQGVFALLLLYFYLVLQALISHINVYCSFNLL